jgi:LmbE family N-acetylglucosaminyl deacetylase
VFAHPDDDVYVMGGSLLLRRERADLTLIFATSGEAGPISDPAQVPRARLGRVREAEQRACLETIGYADARVEWLHHPDYYLPEVPFDVLRGEIETVLLRERPHIMITFGPDGLTSHHDHVTVGKAATEAWHRARAAEQPHDDGAFSALLYAALPRSDVDRFYSEVRARGYTYGEEGALFDVTGVPDASIAIRVDTRAVGARKLAGILEHRTQLVEHERVPEPLRWIHLDSESFVQVHPPRGAGAGLADHPFDALAGSSTGSAVAP